MKVKGNELFKNNSYEEAIVKYKEPYDELRKIKNISRKKL